MHWREWVLANRGGKSGPFDGTMGPAEQQGGSGSGGSTNLFQAVMRSDTVALDKLLSAGAHINRPNMAGLTPLYICT